MNDSLNQQPKPDHLYRKGVGIVIINPKKEIFVGKRIDNHSDCWQMPQGGLDTGEEEDKAMIRELEEETGITQSAIGEVKKSTGHYYYDLPYRLQKKFWGGKYLGQKQRWYLVDFKGSESDININNDDPEFSEWKWVNKDKMIDLIVGFKKQLYVDVIEEFNQHL